MTLRIAPLLLVLALVAGCAETATDAPAEPPVVTAADYTPYGEPLALDDGTPGADPTSAGRAASTSSISRNSNLSTVTCQPSVLLNANMVKVR